MHATNPQDTQTASPFVQPNCNMCGAYLATARFNLGYRCCLDCGEEKAREQRNYWCVAPLHKSNYMLITDRQDLAGLNNKGGLVK